MECKCIYQFACVAPQWELIDTLWNVNLKRHGGQEMERGN